MEKDWKRSKQPSLKQNKQNHNTSNHSTFRNDDSNLKDLFTSRKQRLKEIWTVSSMYIKVLSIKKKNRIIQSNRILLKENVCLRTIIKHWQRLIGIGAESASLNVPKEASVRDSLDKTERRRAHHLVFQTCISILNCTCKLSQDY